MNGAAAVRTTKDYPIAAQMKAWVLGGPDELLLSDKPMPMPGRAEVLVRIDAVAICATEIHAGCGQCTRCRQGMYTSCLNYGKPEKGHRASGFTST